jgi:two-component system KDP operon response regulator KdpE
MNKQRALIVDGDLQLQRVLRAQLLALDFVVRAADRGEDALIVAAEFEPDLILMALALPGINGVEATRRLRQWTQTPIIILNGQEPEHLTAEALDAGADDYVARPCRMAELLARIRSLAAPGSQQSYHTGPGETAFPPCCNSCRHSLRHRGEGAAG